MYNPPAGFDQTDDTQMGCVQETCLRLMNSDFALFGARMNHFEM